MKPDARPAIYTDDVHRADFFAITAPSTPPAFSFNKSSDIRVLWSRAATRMTDHRVIHRRRSESAACLPVTHESAFDGLRGARPRRLCVHKGGRGLLYWLLYQKLFPYFRVFRIFRYLTFRTAFASLTALLIGLLIGPFVIERLREFHFGQYVRDDGPQTHLKKGGTPTMGGVLIVISILLPTLLWADLSNPAVWIVMLSTLAFGGNRVCRRLHQSGQEAQHGPDRPAEDRPAVRWPAQRWLWRCSGWRSTAATRRG